MSRMAGCSSLVPLAFFLATILFGCNFCHATVVQSKLFISEDTDWNFETLQKNSIVLANDVVVLPGATLTIAGKNESNADTALEGSGGFNVVFLANVSITLHGGAYIRMHDTTFHNPNATSADGSAMGRGIETLGTRDDHSEGVVIRADRWKCKYLQSCVTAVGAIEVYDSQFYMNQPFSYAIKNSNMQISRCSFFNSGDSSGIIRNNMAVGRITVNDSDFMSVDGSTTTAMTIPEYSSMTVLRSNFVGYHKGLIAGGQGYDNVQHCTFVGNGMGFQGNDGGYMSRGSVSDSYFWRNQIGQMAHDAKGNVYVENAVAYQRPRSANDLLLYRNVVGFWCDEYACYNNFDEIPAESGRSVANVTFLDNAVSALRRIMIPSSGSSVNFLGSIRYHINYTGDSTIDLASDIYWSDDGRTRSTSDDEARLKIRDGLRDGGGPGIVLINVTSSPLVPYFHPNFPSSDYVPPSLDEWRETMLLPVTVESDFIPSLPSAKSLPFSSYNLFLPLELSSRNFSWWWDDYEDDNASESGGQSSAHHACDDNDKMDDPNRIATTTIVDIRTETGTCGELSTFGRNDLAAWCSSPDSDAATSCPSTCCQAFNEGVVGSEGPEEDRSAGNDEGNSPVYKPTQAPSHAVNNNIIPTESNKLGVDVDPTTPECNCEEDAERSKEAVLDDLMSNKESTLSPILIVLLSFVAAVYLLSIHVLAYRYIRGNKSAAPTHEYAAVSTQKATNPN